MNTERHALAVLLAALLPFAPCCATGGDWKRKRPKPETRKLEEPPDPVEGRVVPLPSPDNLTDEEKKALERRGLTPADYRALLSALGVPEDGFVMTPGKARAAAELRVYAEQLYSDAKYNDEVHRMTERAMWAETVRLGKALDEERTWWNRNLGRISLGAGWVFGAGTTVLVVWGVGRSLE